MTIYFGENLKRLRKEKELTQETLADFLGVSFQTISKWERGETYPDITMLPIISRFFNTTVDDLLGVDKAKKEEKIPFPGTTCLATHHLAFFSFSSLKSS